MHYDPSNRNPQDLANKHVRFRIADVCVPEPLDIVAELHGEDLLSGRIIDLSDSGPERSAYAVVEVEGLSQSVVVAVAKILDAQD